MKSKLRALGNKIFVKPDEVESVSSGGIVLVSTKDASQHSGVVVAAGPGMYDKNGVLVPNCVSVGDKIIFSKAKYPSLEVDGVTLIVMVEDNVVGVVR